MKKLKPLLAGLTLVLAFGVFNASTFTALADDPQGTGDTSKHPPCYPRCRPANPVTPGDSNTSNAALHANAEAATVVVSENGETTITTTVILALVQFWAGL